jgi:hypothetical protein
MTAYAVSLSGIRYPCLQLQVFQTNWVLRRLSYPGVELPQKGQETIKRLCSLFDSILTMTVKYYEAEKVITLSGLLGSLSKSGLNIKKITRRDGCDVSINIFVIEAC